MAKAQAKTSETKVTEVKADVTAVVRKARAPSPVVSLKQQYGTSRYY